MCRIWIVIGGMTALLLMAACQTEDVRPNEEPPAVEEPVPIEEPPPATEVPAEEPEPAPEEPRVPATESPPPLDPQRPSTPAELPSSPAERPSAPAELPSFPWPPPSPSTMMNLDDSALRVSGDGTTLGQMDERLGQALRATGYVEKSYFAVPDGFALVTRLEQIDPDGTPLDPPDRWSAEAGPVREFNLRSILRALFTANPGYFRILVFVATPQPFSQSDEEVRREEAVGWLRDGMNRLPIAVARQRYTEAFQTTVLVYEFEQPESGDPQLVAGRLTARTHLQRSGLLTAIEQGVED